MKDPVIAIAAGFAFGAVFALAGLPVPAPPTLTGAAVVMAATVGYLVVTRLRP